MRRDGVRSATAARDAGLRRITRLTWQIGAAGVASSAVLAAVFGHNAASARAATPRPPATQQGNGQSNGQGNGQGQLQIPAQPPAPAAGAGQVNSGAS
jgi:hypothetical protein